MNKTVLKANCKINLTLDVTGKREDGYHLVSMIMQSLDLCDTVEITKSDKISVFCDKGEVPCDESNIAFKAAKLFFKKNNIEGGAEIKITKRIPVAAGLAGGSADGAAVLKGLNDLYETNKSENELMEAGLEIGADVPFCIMGGTALAEGIGEILTPLKPFENVVVCLAKPNFSVSTPKAYGEIDRTPPKNHPDNKRVIRAIEEGNLKEVCNGLINVFEEVTRKEHPEIDEIKNVMLSKGALGAAMSGSGPSVYGIFDSVEKAQDACNALKEKMFCTVTKTV